VPSRARLNTAYKETVIMIRNLLVTTALAALVAGAAYAQDQTTTPAPSTGTTGTMQPAAPQEPAKPVQAEGFLATNYIGESVYNGTADDAQNIGDVNDLVIDKSGMIKSVVVGVGGFLGIGEKNVAVDFSKLSWMERNGDRWLVTDATKEQLQAAPDFDRTPYEPNNGSTASVNTGNTGTAPATNAPATTAPAQ
jgi:hypothetical protein